MAVRTAQYSAFCLCYFGVLNLADGYPSVMSFVGYDYQKERPRQLSNEWQSITEEELPTGDDDF